MSNNILVRLPFVLVCTLFLALFPPNGAALAATNYLSLTSIGEGATDPAVGVHRLSDDGQRTITAIPADGWQFDHWEGSLSGSTNPAQLTMNANKRVTAVFIPNQASAENALARYAGKLDANYTWYEYKRDHNIGWTKYTIRLISQQWRTADEVDRVLWEHDLGIIEPLFRTDKVLLVIGGGDNGDLPAEVNDAIAAACLLTGITYVQLDQVPNQPLKFADDDGKSRKEDAILAYGLDKALVTGDQEWIAHMAMVKAVVRAMDVVQEKLGDVGEFMLAGASKRGWTTYLAAAVDPRVKAMVPMSIDIPNILENIKHHWEAYGFYAPALHEYVKFDLFCRMENPAEIHAEDALKIIDPMTYFSKYTMPKLLVVSAGDQFFLPDSSRFYFSALPQVKHLRYTVNTDHSQQQAIEKLILFALSWAGRAIYEENLPQFTWSFEADGSIRVETQTTPNAVRLWQAHNREARDFRLETIGPVWTSSPLFDQGNGVYTGYVPRPPTGFSAFLVELDFDYAITLTTEVAITPDFLPFAGTHCQTGLLFADVPVDHWAFGDIEKLYASGITTGCNSSPLMFCPRYALTRDQLAVFLERGVHDGNFVPLPASGIFADVPLGHWAADWIEQCYRDGITEGCSTNPLSFCPDRQVTRAEMAILLLRAKYDRSYSPPVSTGLFADVAPGYWAADWIEQLYREGITTGCSAGPLMFCPDDPVTREEMAAFLVRTFNP